MNRIRIILPLFILIFLFLSPNFSFAQEELTIKEATDSPELSKISKSVEYTLPYPGLLPDNPLYFLKALRDAVVDFLISDPLKKADFYLLQADKRLNAGVYLFNSAKQNEKKINLAISTISKGENYFEKAIAKTREAKKQGMETDEIASRLYESSKKHKEVLNGLEKNVKDSNIRGSLSNIEKRVMGFDKEARSLIKK